MTCMCGDIQCPSCGPAQGNYRCPICRAWADDCCKHLNQRTGEVKARYRKIAEKIYQAEADADLAYAKEYTEDICVDNRPVM